MMMDTTEVVEVKSKMQHRMHMTVGPGCLNLQLRVHHYTAIPFLHSNARDPGMDRPMNHRSALVRGHTNSHQYSALFQVP